MSEPDVDGLLVGGASLEAASFLDVILCLWGLLPFLSRFRQIDTELEVSVSLLTWAYIALEIDVPARSDLPHSHAQWEGRRTLRHVRGQCRRRRRARPWVERNLDRITVTVAIIFAFTTLTAGPQAAVTAGARFGPDIEVERAGAVSPPWRMLCRRLRTASMTPGTTVGNLRHLRRRWPGGAITMGMTQSPTGCNPHTVAGDTPSPGCILRGGPPQPLHGELRRGADAEPQPDLPKSELINTKPETTAYTPESQGGVVRRGRHHRRRFPLRLAIRQRALHPGDPGAVSVHGGRATRTSPRWWAPMPVER